MSTETFEGLIAAAETNPALAGALRAARTLQELVAIGAQRGHVFGEAEARACLAALPSSRELDESELEAVVGGTGAPKPAAKPQPYLKYELKEVLVSSYTIS